MLFGIPVLGVRGDYLAVATMGLGEIVRVIVQSDMAAPLLAGAQGILQIPKPWIGKYELSDPVALFYVTLVASMIAAYCAWRLENSALGRAWMAVRDDEDVAQALGINLVKVKLLAYGLGAAFAGLAGSIFATMLTSIYPSSASSSSSRSTCSPSSSSAAWAACPASSSAPSPSSACPSCCASSASTAISSTAPCSSS